MGDARNWNKNLDGRARGCRASRTFARVFLKTTGLMKSNETNSTARHFRISFSSISVTPSGLAYIAACAIRYVHLCVRLMNWHRPINPVPWGYYVPDSPSSVLHTAALALSSCTSTRYVDTARRSAHM